MRALQGVARRGRSSEGAAALNLHDFVAESNRIEGIPDVDEVDVEAHTRLLACSTLRVEDLCEFVRAVTGERVEVGQVGRSVARSGAGAELRERPGMNVRVGAHFPPQGGPMIHADLAALLGDVLGGVLDPFQAHVRYETLHPFMDGNGRSGRALWAWQMRRDGRDPFRLGFLHAFYYQALQGSRP